MTILGKILVFFVMILALVWNYLVASAYATRANFAAELKRTQELYQQVANQAVNYKKYSDEKVAALEAVAAQSQAAVRDLEGQLRAAQDRIAREIVAPQEAAAAAAERAITDNKLLLTNIKTLEAQVALQREDNKRLSEELNKYVLSEQKAQNDALQARIERDAALRKADDLENRLLALNDQINRERTSTVGGLGAARIPPTDPDFRATVVAAADDIVEISLGSNAKLQKGALLDVWRDGSKTATGQAKFLGRISISVVNPQAAVGRFLPPAGNVKPSAEDRPRPGDLVGVISTLR